MKGYLTAGELAARMGIQRESVYRYVVRGDLPPADEHVGRTPLWHEGRIVEYLAERPGHGWRKGRTKDVDST